MNRITVNGREYNAKPFSFNLVCDIEDMGISLAEAQSKPMALTRAYVALCMDESKDVAGAEMEKHIANGGSFDDIIQVMNKELGDSDFFRNLKTGAESKATEDTKKARAKKNTEI